MAPGHKVGGMVFGYDASKVQAAIEATRAMPGIGYVRVWLASGELAVGDDIMLRAHSAGTFARTWSMRCRRSLAPSRMNA
mgnify:CR=1 FL=1